MLQSATKFEDGTVFVEQDSGNKVCTMDFFKKNYVKLILSQKSPEDEGYTKLLVKKGLDRAYAVDLPTFLS